MSTSYFSSLAPASFFLCLSCLVAPIIATGMFKWISRLFRKPLANTVQIIPRFTRPRSLPCLFALLIGIDNYKKKDIARLEAAVADVDEVKKYLMKYLSVPETQITTLVNEAATRRAIINAIQGFSKNTNIRAGDAILIYFAGHGARVTAPGTWTGMTKHVEVIVPYDMGVDNVPSIPDRTLGALLINLARAKGDNITVILDSCHSGSGTRNDKSGVGFINRGIEITDAILPDLDRDIWGETELSLPVSKRGDIVTGGFAHPGETSHVLLAACQPGEQAREMPMKRHGVFTNALLEALEMYGIQNLTYANLLKNMKSLNNQNPQCEGLNKNRLIFDANPPPLWAFERDVRRYGDRYILQAGKVHGVVNGTKFHVYKNQDQASHVADIPPVVMITKSVKENMADLEPMGSTNELAGPSRLVAIQISAGPDEVLFVYASPEDRMYSMLQRLIEQSDQASRPWRIRLVDKEHEEAPFVGLSLDNNDEVTIEILDQECRCLGIMGTLMQKVKLDTDAPHGRLSDLVGSIAHFHWHLKRKWCCRPLARDMVRIEFSELDQTPGLDEDLGYTFVPKADTRIELSPDKPFQLSVGSKTEMDQMGPSAPRYGFTVRSGLRRSLYVSMFHFDVSNFKITPYYQPPNAGCGNMEPSLPANGVLEIGYGQSGSWGWNYCVEDDQNTDLAYIKVFFSTQPVDLSFLEQNSVFNYFRGGSPARPPIEVFEWWTVTIPMVLKGPSSP